MNGAAEAEAAQQVFAALSDSSRRQVLQLLGENASSASRLSAPLGISRQAVAKHLRILVDAGLARRAREGREVVFELVVPGLGPASDYLRGLYSGAGEGPGW